jgi:hypothetical protein
MSPALELLTLAIGAVAMVLLLPRAPRQRRPSRRPDPPRPADLARVERTVTARVTASGVHVSVRPLLAEIAAARLSRRRRLTTAEARALLGDELWEIVRPNRPSPEDPRGPGLSLAELEEITQRLERL